MITYPVYHVYIEGHESPTWSYLTKEEADTQAAYMIDRRREAGTQYFVKEETVTTDFLPPSENKPRDMYYQNSKENVSGGDAWNTQQVTVHQKGPGTPVVGKYHRDYHNGAPFEPFRQYPDDQEHHYALISTHYEQTDVMDLATGKIIASEKQKGNEGSNGYGFCPVGFYVPDWRDIHDGSTFPGSWWWDDKNDRWPDGTLGFVWGCYWGDDNGWKVQALDLSRVKDGIILRDDRWGYQYIEPIGKPEDFIQVNPGEDHRGPSVTFVVPKRFLISGKKADFYRNHKEPPENDD
jgi:hypothetical protein